MNKTKKILKVVAEEILLFLVILAIFVGFLKSKPVVLSMRKPVSTVTSEQEEVYQLSVAEQFVRVNVGDSGWIEYVYTGDQTITISSSNPDILQIEGEQYRALSEGTVIITCSDGRRNSQCIMEIVEPDR